jgi:uncharacterized protein YqeY
VVGGRRVGGEVEGGDDFGEEEPGAEAAVDLHGAFAIPAEAGVTGEIAFEDRAGVDVVPLAAAEAGEERVELPEALFDEVVVVVVPGVASDAEGAVAFGAFGALPVVGGEDDEGFGFGDEEAGIGAAVEVFGHPGHVAELAVCDPLFEEVAMGGGTCGGDSAVGEAEIESAQADLGLEVVGHGGRCGGGGDWARVFLRGGKNGQRGGQGVGDGQARGGNFYFMSALSTQLTEDMKTAMRAKDTVTLNVVRNLKSALKYAAIEKLGAEGELEEVDALAVVRKEMKKMQDSVEGAEKAERPEAVAAAKAEIAVLERYLPAAMSEGDLEALVEAVIAEVGATSKKEMGAVMKVLQEKAAGRADNRLLSAAVAKRLN